MANRRHIWIIAVTFSILSNSSTGVIAGEPEPRPPHATNSHNTSVTDVTSHDSVPLTPRISRRVGANVTARIESAFDLAVDRLQEHPECRALFIVIGSDGVEMLSTTLYYPAELKLERDLCRRTEGYTIVGGAPTWLCRRFGKLSDRRAAMVLIHEALHHAGLDERPHDPSAPSSGEINDIVSQACRL